MKLFLAGLLAVSTLALAAPASAHHHHKVCVWHHHHRVCHWE